MKRFEYIYENGSHKWGVIARDPEKPDFLIDTNEYVVRSGNKAIITDPGGVEIFHMVFTALASMVNPEDIGAIFSSHQDPDVVSSLSLWHQFNPEIRCYASWLWQTFLPHYGGSKETFVPVPDEGMNIPLGTVDLVAVPAHYLHSSGNLHLYDPKAAILFSGDVGAAMLPEDQTNLYVEDFDKHIRYAAGFHMRFMGSKEAVLNWCERASKLKIDMLCPQHGAIYQGEDAMRFINWFAGLDVGAGLRSKVAAG